MQGGDPPPVEQPGTMGRRLRFVPSTGELAVVTIFRLAVDLADVAAESAEGTEPLDANKEASRLVREHPEADVSVAEVAAVLEEEAEAAGAEVAQPDSPADRETRRVSMNQVSGDKLTVRSGEDSKWWISSAGPADGPYVDEQSAIDAAIDRAKVLAEAGHVSTVVIQRGTEWTEVWPNR
jgi:hypothetical protein